MELTIEGPYYLHRPKSRHSTTRLFLAGGHTLTEYVDKTKYRHRPNWYQATWESAQSNADITAAGIDLHFRVRRIFGLPVDEASARLIEQIRDAALREAWRLSMRRTDDTVLRTMERDREGIEPLIITRELNSGAKPTLYCYSRRPINHLSRVIPVRRELAKRIPQSDVDKIQLVSPFGTLIFKGGREGQERTVTFTSRYRIPKHVWRLFEKTTGVQLTSEERTRGIDRFKKPITKLPNPREAR